MPLTLPHLLDDASFGESLTAHYLPAYLERQRWYTSKGKTIEAIRVTSLPSPVHAQGLWLLAITFADGQQELRVLAVTEVDRAFAPDDARVICRTDRGALIDACGEEGFRAMLYALMAEEQVIDADTGTLRGIAGGVCQREPTYPGSALPPQNSSNTVFTYGADGFFKLFRKTEAGLHPDAELLGYLSKECGFEHVPAFGGSIEFLPAGGENPITLGLLLGRVDHRGEAWEVMQHEMAAYAQHYQQSEALRGLSIRADLAIPLRRVDLPPVLAKAIGNVALQRIEQLGIRTAEMHLHFAAAKTPAMSPEALDEGYWASAKTALLERLHKEHAYASEELQQALQTIIQWLSASTLPRLSGGRIRVHGDYHLGQVLDTPEDIVIIDFEGEPLYDMAYRRRRHPAHKDVAGMVRSLHYAPFAYALQEADGAHWALTAARNWYHVASRMFLTAYYERAGRCSFLPADDAGRLALLGYFLVDKALYELAYERASRPGWINIPRSGVVGVAEMLSSLKEVFPDQ